MKMMQFLGEVDGALTAQKIRRVSKTSGVRSISRGISYQREARQDSTEG
jgi:hypothetical protein